MLNNRILRKFGFKIDQEGIMNRYLRESDSWNTHLTKTKDFIISEAVNKSKNYAVVLGSGWLLDVPLEELSGMFTKLILVDIFHPRQIEHKVNKINNVELFRADISGFVNPVYQTIKTNRKSGSKSVLANIQPLYDSALLKILENADFVVSVNLLNQLDILICDYINKLKIYDEKEVVELKKQIQSSHIKLLKKNRTALITDYEEHNLDEKDKLIHIKKLIHTDLPQDKIMDRWTWNFDLQKTYHTNYKTIFKVVAISL